jgi:hypothetical protein
MHTRSLAVLVVPLTAVLFACPSQRAICRSGVDQVCERVFECQPEQVRQSEQFQAVFGTSEGDCKQRLYANPLRPTGAEGIACDDIDNDQQQCTNLGQPQATNFDVSAARDCRDARDELSCEEYLAQLQDPSLAPEPCNRRCE